MLVLDYSLLLMVVSFAGAGGIQSAQGLHWIIFLGWDGMGVWVGEPCMLCDAHLFLLQCHAGNFVAIWQGEMVLLFSVWHW
jgi:hypothetical protein